MANPHEFLEGLPGWVVLTGAAIAAAGCLWILLKALKWILWAAIAAVLLAGVVLVVASVMR